MNDAIKMGILLFIGIPLVIGGNVYWQSGDLFWSFIGVLPITAVGIPLTLILFRDKKEKQNDG